MGGNCRLIAGWCRVALLAAAMAAAGVMPAQAGLLRATLDLAFFPTSIPGNPVFPAGSLLTGAASFFAGNADTPFLIVGPPIDIGRLGIGEHFLYSFLPGESALGDGSLQLGFSFGGDALVPEIDGFPAGAFTSVDLGALEDPFLQNGPPILPLDPFDPFEINGPPIRLSGRIVAFDDPVVVGTFEVTLSAVPEPSSVALLLGALLLLFGVRRRRQPRQPEAPQPQSI